jgi:hypothetical protein
MTHRGGLSFSIIIWRIGGEGSSFLLPWGKKEREINETTETALSVSFSEILYYFFIFLQNSLPKVATSILSS